MSALDEDQLWLTFYDETGNVQTKELFIEFSDIYASEAGGTFVRRTLKELLEETLEYEANARGKGTRYRMRVIKRLIQVLEEEK